MSVEYRPTSPSLFDIFCIDVRKRRKALALTVLALACTALVFSPLTAFAQSALEGRITQTVSALVRIVNVIIAGFIVWSGFLIAKGDHAGMHRLIYGIVGLLVANTAYLIINYFSLF